MFPVVGLGLEKPAKRTFPNQLSAALSMELTGKRKKFGAAKVSRWLNDPLALWAGGVDVIWAQDMGNRNRGGYSPCWAGSFCKENPPGVPAS